MDHLENSMNEQILKLSTILDISNQLDRSQESRCLKNFNQDSISLHQVELDQFQPLDKLASFHFNEIELDCEPNSQLCDLVSNFEFMATLVPNLDPIPEPTLIPYP